MENQNQNKKTGVVCVVAKTGGIRFQDEPKTWYNPADVCREYVNPELKGRKVEIVLAGANETEFTFIRIVQEKQNGGMTRDEYFENKEAREIENARRISKHGAVNTAIEFLKLNGKTNATLEDVKKTAEEILGWVN